MTIERVVLVVPPPSPSAGGESPEAQRAASWCARLRAGGLDAAVVVGWAGDVATAAAAAEAAASGAGPAAAAPCTLVVPLAAAAAASGANRGSSSPAAPPPLSSGPGTVIPWSSLTLTDTPLTDDCGPLIRAVVQHNHEQAAAAAARGSSVAAPVPPPLPKKTPPLVVGYVMRESRERALAEAGLLYFVPRASGSGRRAVVFMPLEAACAAAAEEGQQVDEGGECGSAEQGNGGGLARTSPPPSPLPPIVDVVLHKASDYLCRSPGRDGVTLDAPLVSPPLRRLLLDAASATVVVVDPLEAVARCVLDRRDITALLSSAFGGGDDDRNGRPPSPPLPVRVRGPKQLFLAEPPESGAALADALAAAGLKGPPYIVKTAAACGVPHAHRMAVALSDEGLWEALAGVPAPPPQQQQQQQQQQQPPPPHQLPPPPPRQPPAPFPLVVQEFVDHGGVQHKAYVLGDELVYAAPPRPSIPDLSEAVEALRRGRGTTSAPPHPPDSNSVLPHLLTFDALKSLPTALPWQGRAVSEAAAAAPPPPLDPLALSAVARRLRLATRKKGGGSGAGLSLFGFDVVVIAAADDDDDADAEAGARGDDPWPQDWVVVDVNYLPNYRGGGERAAAALREVLLKASAAKSREGREETEGI